ncbi:hypothetical protein GCM10009830_05490 [Glycomyces endophyticus]|uniref:Uncharacterized protein n=1 Tax=Glycomyces endophyticus TaxID=480996 RepID=A0ABP4S1D4_9ACTN
MDLLRGNEKRQRKKLPLASTRSSKATCSKSDPLVEIASRYWQASPQVRTHANQLSTLPIPTPADPDPEPSRPQQVEPRPWALSRRLTPETRAAIVAAYQAGARQQDLATHHNLSLSSIKRLLRMEMSES